MGREGMNALRDQCDFDKQCRDMGVRTKRMHRGTNEAREGEMI